MINYYYINKDFEVLGFGTTIKEDFYNVQMCFNHPNNVHRIICSNFEVEFRPSKSKIIFHIFYELKNDINSEVFFNTNGKLYSQDIIKNGLISGESYRSGGPFGIGPNVKIYSQNAEDITQQIIDFLDCSKDDLLKHKFTSEELFQLETLYGEILLLPENNDRLKEVIDIADKIHIFMEEYTKNGKKT